MALSIILLLFLLKSPLLSSTFVTPSSGGDQLSSRDALLREIQESKFKVAQFGKFSTSSTVSLRVFQWRFGLIDRPVLLSSALARSNSGCVSGFLILTRIFFIIESNLERSIQDLNERTLRINACEKKIEELDLLSNSLRNSLADLQVDYSRAIKKVSDLEAELTLLWSVSRRNNFEIHTLESRVQDAEKRLDVVKAQVDEVAEIVSEQWIQIQKLEQAVQLAEFRALNVKRQLRATRCPLLRFIKRFLGEHFAMLNWILGPYLSGGISTLESCISEAPSFLRKTFSAVKHYHHQLQGSIKQYMLWNEVTAVLAHEEVVFLMASIVITSPVLFIFILFASYFG